MALSLVCDGASTRARRVLDDLPPLRAVESFAVRIHVRDMRVSHPTRQRLFRMAGFALSIEGGNLVFNTALPGGGDLSLPLGGEAGGLVTLTRVVVPSVRADYTLSFRRRTGEIVGQVTGTSPHYFPHSIAGGFGLSICADDAPTPEYLRAKVDDFSLMLSAVSDLTAFAPHVARPPLGYWLRYGFAGSGADSGNLAQHLTVEGSEAYETTPELLTAYVSGPDRVYLGGVTPDPGTTLKIFERKYEIGYDYSLPVAEGIATLPYELHGRSNRSRLCLVVRQRDEASGEDGPPSNEVALRPALGPPTAGQARITFDDITGRPYYADSQPPVVPIAADRYRAQGVLLTNGNPPPGAPAGVGAALLPFPDTPWFVLSTIGRGGEIVIDFVVPDTDAAARTGFVSFVVLGTEAGQPAWAAIAYDGAGAVLETVQGTQEAAVVFARAAKDVRRVKLIKGAWNECLDSLTFETPIPA